MKLNQDEFNELVNTKNLSLVREGLIVRDAHFPVYSYSNYIILTDKGFKVIRNQEEFKQFFAPVETPEEALSFAVALTGSLPMYEIKVPKKDRYMFVKIFTPVIETTHIKEIPEGFKVRLFDRTGYCGRSVLYAVDYLVTKDGEVKEISRKEVYETDLGILC